MISLRSEIAHTSFVAILLCFSCGNSDNGSAARGSGGQSGGGGVESGGSGSQSKAGGGQGGASDHAGASGEAGAEGNEPDGPGIGDAGSDAGSDAGGAGSDSGGTGGAGDASGGDASAGSTNSGGSSGSNECVWDPATVTKCPACDGNADCADPGYKYIGSGAITASCCGFEWQEETAPGKYSWSQANEYCASLSLSGRGWRLPKIAELFSLVDLSDESHASPTIDVEAFADTLRELYWSSTLYGNGGPAAWTVNFSDGGSQPTSTDDTQLQRVRCVR